MSTWRNVFGRGPKLVRPMSKRQAEAEAPGHTLDERLAATALIEHQACEAVVVGQSEQCDSCGADLVASATARPGLWHQRAAILCACGHEYAVQSAQVEVAS